MVLKALLTGIRIKKQDRSDFEEQRVQGSKGTTTGMYYVHEDWSERS